MTRTDARELFMQLLFQMQIQNDYSDNAKELFLKDKNKLGTQTKYFNDILEIIKTHEEEIIGTFESHSMSRKFTRLSKIDMAIFKIAIAEILYIEDIPSPVSVNEAVELSKKYSTDESTKLINAILVKISKSKE